MQAFWIGVGSPDDDAADTTRASFKLFEVDAGGNRRAETLKFDRLGRCPLIAVVHGDEIAVGPQQGHDLFETRRCPEAPCANVA